MMTGGEKENRKFGLIVGAAFCVLGALRCYKTGHINYILPCIGFLLMLCGLLFYRKITPLRLVWEKIGSALGYINSIVILTVIYLVVVSPIGVMKRILKKDPLKLKWHTGPETYWETEHTADETDLKRQF